MGFRDVKVDVDVEHRSASIVVFDHPPSFREHIPAFVESMNHISQALSQRSGTSPFFFDVNNYRKEREKLLSDLARAAARKAVATRQPVTLPAMNSYERRIIHVELAGHPDVVTGSEGAGKERFITVRLVGDEPPSRTSGE